ncbi:MAG: ArdC family protein [Gammaproteobacteria bacterium]
MARTQSDLYQSITDRIVASLEAGVAPWIKPWKNDRSGGSLPHNAITGRCYHGINTVLLRMQECAKGYGSPQWLTFKQAQERGGHVRQGEKGTEIIFWKFRKVTDSETREDRTIPMLRTYYVFNVAQCADLELPARRNVRAPIDATEIDGLVARTGAAITHGGDRACYRPSADVINMPHRAAFRDLDAYHGTLLHELTHWTGHPSRCARDLSGRFGQAAYAAEELIAEMGSAFLCASLSVPLEGLQHADYIGSWIKVLKDDNRAIFTAAKAAQVACDYVLQLMGLQEAPDLDDDDSTAPAENPQLPIAA